jgi:TonB family protein
MKMQIPRFARDDKSLSVVSGPGDSLLARKNRSLATLTVMLLLASGAAYAQEPAPAPRLTSLKLCSDKTADPNTCVQKLPRAKHSPKPSYTKRALQEGIQGIVLVQLVVETDGKPRDVAVVRSLGYGLDEKAVEAVKKWRFHPAIGHDGKPVAAPITIEIAFQAPASDAR